MYDDDDIEYTIYSPRKYKPKTDEQKRTARNKHYIRKYGITLDEYETMCVAQDHKCLICTKVKPLVVDHCHSEGHIRGLLCAQCNSVLGMAYDDVAILTAAINYLSS